MKIDVNTRVEPDRSVTCDIEVAGRAARVTFGDGEVTFSAMSGGGEITFSVPLRVIEADPAG